MDDAVRVKLGVAGLLLFEVTLGAYLASLGSLDFTLMALAGAGALAYALFEVSRTGRVTWIPLALLALITFLRAVAQNGAGFPAVLPSYAVAVGFAVAAYGARTPGAATATRGGIALVALCRSWFLVSYLMADVPVIALANALGALGAWVWASASGEPAAASGPSGARA
ncbi:MAG: hypothetical protein LC624_01720 [Halobacteriales archaeon]|nr:hypothetical protein [Halobacteriales archaeon]